MTGRGGDGASGAGFAASPPRPVIPSPVDVCLLLEGTYPYIAGGVSSWVHQIIQAMPEIRFALVHIGARPEPGRKLRYTLPPNVVGMTELYVHDGDWIRAVQRDRGGQRSEAIWRCLRDLHGELRRGGKVGPLDDLFDRLRGTAGFDQERYQEPRCAAAELFYSKSAWDLLAELHQTLTPDASFVDFFWTWRYSHLPIFYLLEAPVPRARVYHTVSTGYAGFLAAIAKRRTGAPVILTEHGIYTRERKIEIAQAEWVYVKDQPHPGVARRRAFFKDWWIGIFKYLSTVVYHDADSITTITQLNQQLQLADGGDIRKMQVIPNGINLGRFLGLRKGGRKPGDLFLVGFVGRVVPIKDVKTFIRAVKIAAATIPDLKAFVIGPTDEDPDYHAECLRLTTMLGLDGIIVYTGRADVRAYYEKIDALVLTSISEGQPLVIMEANAAGVPAIASNVGACAELIDGGTQEDRALGPSGTITGVANPEETARAMIQLWRDIPLWERMSAAGQERICRYYDEKLLFARYRELYNHSFELFERRDGGFVAVSDQLSAVSGARATGNRR